MCYVTAIKVNFSTPFSVIFLCQSILYNGLVVYAPALAMNQVAGLDINLAILLVGGVCIFYTSLGGMKAVIWGIGLDSDFDKD